MKLNKLAGYMAIAGVCSSAVISLPAIAQEPGKAATAQTKEANDALYTQLPFADKTDFANAHIILKEETLKQAENQGDVRISGNHAKVVDLLSYMDKFEFWFNIVTP
ncbi:alkyl sulfatase C-terminal domain-containing protein [Kluyvera sp. 142486]|uniref:alkyl sulfatase C-terminal domain-containing protein n=1 Tax=Kluyvera sp. 142486 TaxID=3390050 RepID=UPI00398127E0